MSRGIYQLGVVELAKSYRERELDPVEVIEGHIQRIQKVNPQLNAVIADRFSEAREEAILARDRFKSRDLNNLPPLLGIPCTIKEFCGVEGMPHTGGVWAMRDHKAKEDGTVVARLREAGAIILGITNVPEGGVWHETNNPIFGRTNNPWDTNRTCGGSSGGEASIIAAGGSVFGVGSDVGGSVRIPSAFCGIVGHKPTHRMIPTTGHYPPAIGGRIAPFTHGPMCRKVKDIYPLLKIMAGPDHRDPLCKEWELKNPDDVDIRSLTVFPVETNGRVNVSKELRQTVRTAARCLERRGATVRELKNDKLKYAFDMWAAVMKEFGPQYAEIVGENGEVALLRELSRYPRSRSAHTGPVLFLMVLEKLLDQFSGKVQQRLSLIQELQAELEHELGDTGILLHPPFSRHAPRHRAIAFTLFDAACTALFNVLEFPVTQIPMGMGNHKMPLGVQVAAARGHDHLTIAAANAIENDVGGWELVEPHRSRMWLTLV
jgi:fatty acid amide hydrolase 2